NLQSLFSRSAKDFVNPAGICWTIKIGAGKSAGIDFNNLCRARGPPVDVPIMTIDFSRLLSLKILFGCVDSEISESMLVHFSARTGLLFVALMILFIS